MCALKSPLRFYATSATVLFVAACGVVKETELSPPTVPASPALEQLLGTAVVDTDYPWSTPGIHSIAWLELSSDPWPFAFPQWEIPLGWYAENAFDQFVVDIPAPLEAQLTDGFVTGYHLRYQVGDGVQGYAPGHFSVLYTDDAFDVGGVDFEGCELTELHVTVQDVAFNQYYPGIGTIFYCQLRLEVWGFPPSP